MYVCMYIYIYVCVCSSILIFDQTKLAPPNNMDPVLAHFLVHWAERIATARVAGRDDRLA